MPSNAEHASLATLFDSQDKSSSSLENASVISLPHPRTGDTQHFISVHNNVYELQSLSRPYGSFLVGSRILSNGSLHVMTRIDPLFFILANLSNTQHQHQQQQWQPLDQFEIPSDILAVVEESQWKHLCTVKNLGDALTLYKFCPERALQWLIKKQEAAFAILCRQRLHSKLSTEKENLGGGAFSNSFQFADDDDDDETKQDEPAALETTTTAAATTNTPATTATTTGTTTMCHYLSCAERATLKEESVSIVCEYLSETWQTKVRSHFGIVVPAFPDKATGHKRPRSSWESNPGQDDADQLLAFTMGSSSSVGCSSSKDGDMKKKDAAKSAGLKRLSKVNTKGMKSLSSFFGAKK
jgi:hypothetical protein